jgi:hypothetical protein
MELNLRTDNKTSEPPMTGEASVSVIDFLRRRVHFNRATLYPLRAFPQEFPVQAPSARRNHHAICALSPRVVILSTGDGFAWRMKIQSGPDKGVIGNHVSNACFSRVIDELYEAKLATRHQKFSDSSGKGASVTEKSFGEF